MAGRRLAGKESVTLFFVEKIRSLDEQGRLTQVRRLAYRVDSAAADSSWSQVSEVWLPWHQQEPRLRARVVTAAGQEYQLDPHVLSRSDPNGQDPEMFSDQRELRGPLPAIGPGAIVEEEETVADTAPLFDRGTTKR